LKRGTDPPVGYAVVNLSTADEARRAIVNLSGEALEDRKFSIQLTGKPEKVAATRRSYSEHGCGHGLESPQESPNIDPQEALKLSLGSFQNRRVGVEVPFCRVCLFEHEGPCPFEEERHCYLCGQAHEQSLDPNAPCPAVPPCANCGAKHPHGAYCVNTNQKQQSRYRTLNDEAKCTYCGSKNHASEKCSFKERCKHCGTSRHLGTACKQPFRQSSPQKKPVRPRDLACEHCGSPRHLGDLCPLEFGEECRVCGSLEHVPAACSQQKKWASLAWQTHGTQCKHCKTTKHLSEYCPIKSGDKCRICESWKHTTTACKKGQRQTNVSEPKPRQETCDAYKEMRTRRMTLPYNRNHKNRDLLPPNPPQAKVSTSQTAPQPQHRRELRPVEEWNIEAEDAQDRRTAQSSASRGGRKGGASGVSEAEGLVRVEGGGLLGPTKANAVPLGRARRGYIETIVID